MVCVGGHFVLTGGGSGCPDLSKSPARSQCCASPAALAWPAPPGANAHHTDDPQFELFWAWFLRTPVPGSPADSEGRGSSKLKAML